MNIKDNLIMAIIFTIILTPLLFLMIWLLLDISPLVALLIATPTTFLITFALSFIQENLEKPNISPQQTKKGISKKHALWGFIITLVFIIVFVIFAFPDWRHVLSGASWSSVIAILVALGAGIFLQLTGNWKEFLKMAVIFGVIYTLVVFVPLLRPFMAPLLSDYGSQITVSLASLAQIFGRQAVDYSAGSAAMLTETFKVIFIKAFVFSLYAFALYLIAMAPEVVTKWVIRRYYGVKGAVEEEKSRIGTQRLLATMALDQARAAQLARGGG